MTERDSIPAVKIMCVIPVYKPNPANLNKIVKYLIDHKISVYLYFNSDFDNSFCDQYQTDMITCCGNGYNMGTAYAYNKAADYLLGINEITSLLILDQDSAIDSRFCKVLLSYNYINAKHSIFCALDLKNLYNPKKKLINNRFRPIIHTKASGLLIPRLILEQFRFDESLFVDYVDWAFCWEVHKKNIQIFEDSFLELSSHQLGESYCLLGFHFNAPSRNRRKIQLQSAFRILTNFQYWAHFSALTAPTFLRILFRFAFLPVLEFLEFCSFVHKED